MVPPRLIFFAVSLTSVFASKAVDQTYIITCRHDANAPGLCREFELKAGHHYQHALNGFSAVLNSNQVARLLRDKRVAAVEPDGFVQPCLQTIPAGVVRMGIPQFPISRITGQDRRIDVDVAVIDTGIQLDHPDLNVVQGVDIPGHGTGGNDTQGHGTHMAGTIGALDNDIGVVGVAHGARLWAVNIYGTNAVAPYSDVIAGMDYVAQHSDQIAVANCSFASRSSAAPLVALRNAFSNVVSHGVVIVAAVGNEGADFSGNNGILGDADDILPAALPEVMAVSSIDPATDIFDWPQGYCVRIRPDTFVHSPGSGIDVAAPGVNILSTWIGNGYLMGSGTSAACAHGSGLVALYIAANGRAHSAQGVYAIRQKIVDNGLPQPAWISSRGPGYNYYAFDADSNPEPMAIASESWIPAPKIVSQSNTLSGFALNFRTVPGYRYTLQSAESLSVSNQWTDHTLTNGTGHVVTLGDSAPGTNRFYRIKREPAP